MLGGEWLFHLPAEALPVHPPGRDPSVWQVCARLSPRLLRNPWPGGQQVQEMWGHVRELFQPGLLYPVQKAVSSIQREVPAHLSARHLDPPEYPGMPGRV
ncbi:hypothetical protein LEMLEM_LOCUS506 [Lemmus lemmus]